MNPIAEEIKSYYGSASSIEEEEDILEQSGIPQMFDYDPHGSGRYRQGSGENPYQHATDGEPDTITVYPKHFQSQRNH